MRLRHSGHAQFLGSFSCPSPFFNLSENPTLAAGSPRPNLTSLLDLGRAFMLGLFFAPAGSPRQRRRPQDQAAETVTRLESPGREIGQQGAGEPQVAIPKLVAASR